MNDRSNTNVNEAWKMTLLKIGLEVMFKAEDKIEDIIVLAKKRN